MQVIAIPAWAAATNAYLIFDKPGSTGVLIDAPPDPNLIASVAVEHDVSIAAVLLTHGHIDHTGGAGEIARSHGSEVYVHPDDDFLTLHPLDQVRRMFGMEPPGSYEVPERLTDLDDGKVLDLAGFGFETRHTPGHTPGHCVFYLGEHEILFSGDQLFAGSIGRTDLPGGSTPELMASMVSKVLVLPDDTRVLPGHGSETTIRRERHTNPFRTEWEAIAP